MVDSLLLESCQSRYSGELFTRLESRVSASRHNPACSALRLDDGAAIASTAANGRSRGGRRL